MFFSGVRKFQMLLSFVRQPMKVSLWWLAFLEQLFLRVVARFRRDHQKTVASLGRNA